LEWINSPNSLTCHESLSGNLYSRLASLPAFEEKADTALPSEYSIRHDISFSPAYGPEDF
jgi:hypothetical protein